MKNGRKAIKGKCPTCGTVMFKILGGKATPPAAARRTRHSARHQSDLCRNSSPTSSSRLIRSTNPAPAAFSRRLITRTGLDLAGLRMFAPSAELVKEYAETIVSAHDTQDRKIQELLKQYVLENLSPDPKTGRRRRVMMMLFRGDEAVRKVRSVVGNLESRPPRRRNHPRHLQRLDHG